MRKAMCAMAFVLAFSSAALAGPKDQKKDSLIGKDGLAGNGTVDNTITDFKIQAKGCKLQIKAKGLQSVVDGQKIICIAGADVISPPALTALAGNSVVFVGDVKGGKLGIKADLTEIQCGTADAIQVNGDVTCYLDDAAYRTPTGTWQGACTGAGGAAGANAATDPDTLKSDPTQNVIVGLCQAFVAGVRIGPPASAEIARLGSRQYVIP